ncbi:MAG: GDCCVxC domain-containing (seleno)protein [Balneolaceae bacterium]|nr:GDCCVxC domain-containing (seleno)protein [Balneolaceae bacterium]
MSEPVQTTSTITCPECGTQTPEIMPDDACVYFWDCPNCGQHLQPEHGDCCVFCSYGSIPCPPRQAAEHCGCC